MGWSFEYGTISVRPGGIVVRRREVANQIGTECWGATPAETKGRGFESCPHHKATTIWGSFRCFS